MLRQLAKVMFCSQHGDFWTKEFLMEPFFLLGCAYAIVYIFLAIRCFYMASKLESYVKNKYPEKATIFEKSRGQGHPWSPAAKWIRYLLKNENVEDLELVHLAQKIRRSKIHLFLWFILVPVIMLFAYFVFFFEHE